MTVVEVEPGSCGFTTTVRAAQRADGQVAIEGDSPCEMVTTWLDALGAVDPVSIMRGGPGLVCARCHAGCLVPVATVKAIEVEAGLNLPRPASIRFVEA
ncbi:MAG: hypothetical protein IT204_16275 [Fimbriimonadaceae bacterium]|nr:hypothetical protein [Fimbriimonadaceae bacterium]